MHADAANPPAERLVLGIDPGLTATGYGLIAEWGRDARAIAWGAIRTRASVPRAERLAEISRAVGALIEEHQPYEVAIEQQYVKENVRSAMAIGEARAAAMIAAAMRGVPVFEFSPATVKEAVAGHGGATKERVQTMVMLQLGLTSAPHPLDASDALAIALTRLAEARTAAAMVRRA